MTIRITWGRITALVAGTTAILAGAVTLKENISKLLPGSSSLKTNNWVVGFVNRVPKSKGDYATSFLQVETVKDGVLPIQNCTIEISYPSGFAIERAYVSGREYVFEYGPSRQYRKIDTIIRWEEDGILVRQYLDYQKERKLKNMRARIRCASLETEWQDIDVPGHDGWEPKNSN